MSENNNPQRPRYSPSRYTRAFDIVRSILDDQALSHDVSPTGELYRAIERFHRGMENANMSDNSHSSFTPTGSAPQQHPILPPLRSANWPSRRQSPMSSGGDHMPPRRRANYLRSRLSEHSPQPANSEFSPLRVSSFDWDSHDYPSTVNPAHLISPPGPDDYNEDARRIKRRKLDADTYSSFYPAFRYGRYGQVEPGELKMEIVNCDGGLFKDEARYAAENILHDDKSVYCTQGNRCNIMLKHQGGTVFSLKELVIKAPGSDFTAPVREGFVFISMTNDDILNRTARFQIQYRTSARDPEAEPIRQERPPTLAERYSTGYPPSPHVSSLPTPSVVPGGGPLPPLPPMFSTNFGPGSMSRGSASRARVGRLSQLGAEDEENEQQAYSQSQSLAAREAQIPKEFNQDPPPFTVTTEYGNDEDEDGLLGYRRRAPNRIGSLPFERIESDDSDEDGNPFTMDNFEDLARWRRREHNRRRHMHVAESLSPGLAEEAGASQAAMLEAVQAVGGNLLAAHAKFCIDKDKNKCTIKFDPPVSGRFILLKIWNPDYDPSGNIDIRAVIAKGFAGPRYFPKIELR